MPNDISPEQQLLQHQGWKVIDLTPTKRVHASEILGRLPEQVYYSLEGVIQALKTGTSKS